MQLLPELNFVFCVLGEDCPWLTDVRSKGSFATYGRGVKLRSEGSSGGSAVAKCHAQSDMPELACPDCWHGPNHSRKKIFLTLVGPISFICPRDANMQVFLP